MSGCRNKAGRLFQILGPAAEKLLSPNHTSGNEVLSERKNIQACFRRVFRWNSWDVDVNKLYQQ